MRYWWTPLTGVAFVVLMVIGAILGGEPPDVTSPVEEIVDYYSDDSGTITAGAITLGLGTIFLVFFAGALSSAVRRAQGELRTLPVLVIVGAGVFATGIAIDTTITLALAQAVDDIEPLAVQTLQAFWDYDFMAIAVGAIVFFVSTSIAIIQTGLLARWFAWLGILAAILMLTPIFWVGFIAAGLWILAASVTLTLRERAVTE